MEKTGNQERANPGSDSTASPSTINPGLVSQETSVTTEEPQELPQPGEEPEEVERLRGESNAKVDELQALNDKYLRLYAEFENYKRRAQRDQNETARFANEKLLKDLLPTVDNLERAIQCGQEQTSGEGLLEGVKLTHKQFLDTLTKLGVSQITSVGNLFDPAKHQAVAQVESSTVEANCVVEEFQKGYFLHDRILRPAMVTVAANQTEPDPTPTDKTSCHDDGGEQA